MLARYTEASDGLFTIVGGGIDNVAVSEVPAIAQCFIGVQLRYGQEEVGSEPVIEFVVRDDHTEPVGEPAPLQLPRLGLNPNHPPGWEASVQIAGPFQVMVPTEGSYSVNIVVDGAMKGDIPFRVSLPG